MSLYCDLALEIPNQLFFSDITAYTIHHAITFGNNMYGVSEDIALTNTP